MSTEGDIVFPIIDIPSVGCVVHYVAYGTPGGEFPSGVCRAAVVTEMASDNEVGLCILNPTGLFFRQGAMRDPDKTPGSWHWPEWLEAS